jgi:hypothetical protein
MSGVLPPPARRNAAGLAAERFSNPSPTFEPGIGELRMSFLARRAPQGSLVTVAAGLLLVAAFQGCNESQLDKVAEEQAKQNGFAKQNLAKLSGHVTVDGLPPAAGTSLVVILNDPEHLNATANGKRPEVFTVCGAQGDFAIMTKPGKYVVTFVALHQAEMPRGERPVGRGLGPSGPMSRGNLMPPDDLKNLYNDPDKNANEETYKLDLKLPGQDGYQVDLAVAGKDAVKTPGPNAVTLVTARR